MSQCRLSRLLAIGAVIVCLPAAGPAPAQTEAPTDPGSGVGRAGRSTGTEGHLSVEEKITILTDKLAANPIDAQGWSDLGALYTSQSDYAAARDAFIHAVQCDRQNGDTHRNLGLAFSRLNEPAMALAEFNEYRRLDQFGGKDFWLLIGGAQRQTGAIKDARQTYRDGLAELGTPPGPDLFRIVLALHELENAEADDQAVHDLLEAWAPLAAAFLDSLGGAEADAAADGCREATTIVRQYVAGMIGDAEVMEQSGLDAEALALFEKAFALAPARPDLLPRIVAIQIKLGRLAEAEAATAKARSEQPELTATWLASAKVYEQSGRLEEALIAYRKAAGLGQVDGLRLVIGTLFMRLERNEEAAVWLQAGLTPDATPDYLYCYALSLMRGARFVEAIPHLQKVVAERPEMFQAWQSLAQCLQNSEQYAAAIEPYQKLLDLKPDPMAAFLVGSMAQKAKQTDRAIAAYQKSLELDPNYDKAQNNLALCFLEAKRYEQAAPAFIRLIEIEGPSYRAQYNVGLSYYYLGKYEQSLEAFKAALALEKTVNVLNGIGLVWDKLDNKVEASSWYQAAKEFDAGLKKK
jgi:tetratricopeptide (TPR) repeat protein